MSRDAVAGDQSPQSRHPVNLVVLDGGRGIITANQLSGTLSWLDATELKVQREIAVGKSLSDVISVPSRSLLLVTDEANHELVAVQVSGKTLSVSKRLKVSPYPVTVRANADGSRAYVASLWSRTLTVVDLVVWLDSPMIDATAKAQVVRLPFAPREQVYVETADKLIVADAFGSRLAVIDPASGSVESVRELPAHGIRQLRLHPGRPRLLLTHQMLSRLAHTTFDDVHWGGLMVNCLRSLPLDDVLQPHLDPIKQGQLDYIGGPEQGAGDPAGFVMRADKVVAIALSGTNEVVFDDGNHLYAKRVAVGDRPTAMALDPDGQRAFVINTLADSVSVLDLDKRAVIGTISLGQALVLSAADRGERLFHSAQLSHDRWFSCASCHVDGHTSGQLNDNFTDGSFGTAKRILTLRGVGDTAPYAWSGRFPTLADQIQHSIKSTMQGEALSDDQTLDLEAYLRTLPAAPAVGATDHAAAERGAKLFRQFDCNRCHSQPAYTSNRIADVNLKDERGNSKYNPPSLRGVSQNAPYFHDGRAATLDEVLLKYQHQLDAKLSEEQVHDLVQYLNSL
jgi:YVTN family beta-propeller protein